MTRTLLLAFGLALWCVAIYGATQMHAMELEIKHTICGPWGCAAAPEALLGYHSLLVLVISPFVALVCRWAPPPSAQAVARGAILLGLLGLVGLTLGGSIAWLTGGNDSQYALQRGFFVLATTPDLPALPLLLGGLAGRSVVRKDPPPSPEAEVEPPGDHQPCIDQG